MINTFAGDGSGVFGGDNGNPLLAELCGPQGVVVSHSGDVYIGDVCNNRVRLVTMHPMVVNNILDEVQSVDVYPNPSSGVFSFLVSSNKDEQIKINIINIVGVRVKEFYAVTNAPFKVELNVPPGIYYLSAITTQKQINEKIIIQ